MEFLDQVWLGNSVRDWLVGGLAGLATALAVRLIVGVLPRKLAGVTTRTDNPYDEAVIAALEKTRAFFLLAMAVHVGRHWLTLSGNLTAWIDRLVVLAVLLQIGLWASAWVESVLESWKRRRYAEDPEALSSLNLVRYAALTAVWAVVLLLFLDNIGVDITTLVAGLGIGGVAVALALQNILGDLFASLSIVIDKPFLVGDFLAIGEFMGTVEAIGLKTTRLRSQDGEQLVFSNGDLLGSRIRNYGRMQERRAVFSLGVTYGTAPAQVRAIPDLVRRAIESKPNTRFQRSHFKSFGDSALEFESVYYMTVPDFPVYMDVQQAINLELMEEFAARGIEFAFPTRTVYVEGGAGSARSVDGSAGAV